MKILIKAVFAVLTFFSVTIIYADVNLQYRFGPVRNQGDSNLCHAFVAADLLDEFFFDDVQGKNISAIDVALNSVIYSSADYLNIPLGYYQLSEFPYRRSGYLDLDILSYLLDIKNNHKGICDESSLPSELGPPHREDQDYLLSKYNLNRKFFDNTMFNELSWMREANRIRSYCARQGIDESRINDALSSFNSFKTESSTEYLNKIISILSQHRPVAIGYNLRPIITGEIEPVVNHFGIIVEYKENKNTKDYDLLIRHSYGADCVTPLGRPIPNCSGGYQWVKGEKLVPYIFGLYWLSKPNL